MRDTTIARNYAEALVALARKANDLEGYGVAIRGLADAVSQDVRLTNFLASPSVSAADKNRVLGQAFASKLPRNVVRFVQKLVDNRRQLLLGEVAQEYSNIVDEQEGRVHATVTVSRETTDAERDAIGAQISARLGKKVVPHVTVNPAILGGVIVKVGDTVMDGSVRKRLATLRTRLTSAR
jgi:F-type H+-transporting ATPase subunit delta